jgi:hypothetical protein
MHSDGETL